MTPHSSQNPHLSSSEFDMRGQQGLGHGILDNYINIFVINNWAEPLKGQQPFLAKSRSHNKKGQFLSIINDYFMCN